MKKEILVIDDNKINRMLLGDVLSLGKYEYKLHESVSAALCSYKKGDADLILMDIEMPHISGIEGYELFREVDADCKIIAVTANVFPNDIQLYEEVGFDGIIKKPFKIKELLETVENIIK